ncbi:cyclodeaminase/cyclohydrolase family protein [Loigolactobacillus zhaoyuanensis]|uniref:Cyclodeaminase/cyclohydrolase family protein n=1 Tax=Loigolactobacillus zhaoyuanensis TaxID=2486017 RepID=A0ABW8UDS1_9LACO|nr:cyclodeaminase/cyclohydrolase family protein [Loigolactobacillus zhaoyuanensis]
MELEQFMQDLASAAPTPSGGGASALSGATAAALASMVVNLTQGKRKYAAYAEELQQILVATQQLLTDLLAQIPADAAAFAPLAHAYSIPKSDPQRTVILEAALVQAASAPLVLLRQLATLVPLLETLLTKGSQIMQSDVGVAAAACRSALEGAILNVYVNTQLMQDRQQAATLNAAAAVLVNDNVIRCQRVYQQVAAKLQ